MRPDLQAPVRLAILGSTGSIGRQTLEVVRAQSRHSEFISESNQFTDGSAVTFEVVALVANNNATLLASQAAEFGVQHLALGNSDGAAAVAALAELPDADIVVNALVGAAGLEASYRALKAGKILALANKESLVVGGELLMPLARKHSAAAISPANLRPIDSEHGAIWQCLTGENPAEVTRLWITASGGPFRGYPRQQLQDITAAQALAHPTWQMGSKITIDSATLMNKGLEIIEAHHLFAMPFDAITPIVHAQSVIHSMVEFTDGSVKAHLGATDMRIPIQYALSYPHRLSAPLQPLDLLKLAELTFCEPDTTTFRCLSLAVAAGRAGGTLPCVLNAANEVAVAAFLAGQCGFLDIERIVEQTLERHDRQKVESIDHLQATDAEARAIAKTLF
jgi:1-deoxy-D-xylulose-5-phosphate reductoisomerase